VNDEAPGCVTIPVLIVVVPLRLLWEVLVVLGRFVAAYLLRPLGWLISTVLLRPLGWAFRVLVIVPLRWLAVTVLLPVGRFVARYVLRPVVIAIARVLDWILTPLYFAGRWIGRGLAVLWRNVFRPMLAALGRGLLALSRVLVRAWRLAGLVLYHVLVRPVAWLWRALVRPVLHAVRRAWRFAVSPVLRWLRTRVWEPARAVARSVSRALGVDSRGR
jgi:hypothetical protein